MKILIAYATTEGQTRKVGRYCADWLVEAGHTVELLPVLDCDNVDLTRFDRVILAGSVHIGHYQKELLEFAADQSSALSELPVLFLSVSLSAASKENDDRLGLEKVVSGFVAEIGWTPTQVEHVAGAFRFTKYDFFKSWALRWIAVQKGQKIDINADNELTDWQALATVLEKWAG
ncbi:MAG: flavodoxin domain-containing protein [Paracoccaceae bacterium]